MIHDNLSNSMPFICLDSSFPSQSQTSSPLRNHSPWRDSSCQSNPSWFISSIDRPSFTHSSPPRTTTHHRSRRTRRCVRKRKRLLNPSPTSCPYRRDSSSESVQKWLTPSEIRLSLYWISYFALPLHKSTVAHAFPWTVHALISSLLSSELMLWLSNIYLIPEKQYVPLSCSCPCSVFTSFSPSIECPVNCTR